MLRPRPSSVLKEEFKDQLRREKLWRRLAVAAAVAAFASSSAFSDLFLSVSLPRQASPPSLDDSTESPRPVPLPPSFGEGADGYFPRGCVWREVSLSSKAGGDDDDDDSSSSSPPPRRAPPLEFFVEETGTWTREMPRGCTIDGEEETNESGGVDERRQRLQPQPPPAKTKARAPSPPFRLSSTTQHCDSLACTYREGIWLDWRGRWYALDEGEGGEEGGAGEEASETTTASKTATAPAPPRLRRRRLEAGKISRNLWLSSLRVSSAEKFAAAVGGEGEGRSSSSGGNDDERDRRSVLFLRGKTLVVDFGFYRHPSAIGHWAEVAGQVASHVFAAAAASCPSPPSSPSSPPFDRVVLLHVPRRHFGEWARAALAAALRIEPGRRLPPVYFQSGRGVEGLSSLRPPAAGVALSSPSPLPPRPLPPPPTAERKEAPTRTGLEGTGGDLLWLAFEEVVVVRDTATGGPRFASPAAAASEWRARMFRLHGLPTPEEGERRPEAPPPTVLYLRKRTDRRVLNEAALLLSLRASVGARVVATDFTAPDDDERKPPRPMPVKRQLQLLSSADVLLSTHTSALAGAAFLRRGANSSSSSAVVELVHYNWGSWGKLDESFRAMTSSFDEGEDGSAIRHGSWRASRRRHAAYPSRRDASRFGRWLRGECTSESCVEAHTRVDVVADVETVTELVRRAIEGKEVEWGAES